MTVLKYLTLLTVTGLSLCPLTASAQFTTGTVYQTLIEFDSPVGSDATLYDPDVFVDSAGALRVLAQGGHPQNAGNIDSIFAAKRTTCGVWNMASPYATIVGNPGCPNAAGTTEPVASPSTVEVDGKLFMAFVGGNADFDRGRVYWARSLNGGASWSVYDVDHPTDDPWTPILTPYYGDKCAPYGIGQVSVAFERDWFYLICYYEHPAYTNPINPLYRVPDVLVFRFHYNPTSFFGLHETGLGYVGGQIFLSGSGWEDHTGKLVWSYEKWWTVCKDTGLPEYYACFLPDVKLSPYGVAPDAFHNANGAGYGGGDLKYGRGPYNWSGWWRFSAFGGTTYYQFATRPDPLRGGLDQQAWTSPEPLDMSAFHATMSSRYPDYTPSPAAPGVYVGEISGRMGWWLFQPVAVYGGGGFAGNRIAVADLNY